MSTTKRYDRQMKLPEVGLSGQQKLSAAKVLVIGAGGLGCPVLQNLVAAGVGKIGIVDGDAIEESNLHRQLLYTFDHCGQKKADVAANICRKQNPSVAIAIYSMFFSTDNALEIAAGYDIIVDCTDDIEARYLINDVTLQLNIPMVYASVHKFEGQLSVFNYQNGPSYRCVFPEIENGLRAQNCDEAGVLGSVPNTLGVMQATEVLKIILNLETVISGKILLLNCLSNVFQNIEIQKNNNQIEIGLTRNFSDENFKNRTLKSLPPGDFIQLLKEPDIMVVDIREIYEEPNLPFEDCNCVPLSELDKFLSNVSKDQKIILVCQSGHRSKEAAAYLSRGGFMNVFDLEGGIESLNLIKNQS